MDMWGPATLPNNVGEHFNNYLSSKRGMYIALQHAELAVDMVRYLSLPLSLSLSLSLSVAMQPSLSG